MKALAFILATAIAAPASAAWRRVDSPNFIVVGDASARELRSIATRFEAFHEVLRRMLGSAAGSAPVPTVVIVFPNNAAFEPYQPAYQGKARHVAGYAADGRSANYIAMLNAGDFTDEVIFHEYTHLVVANAVARAPIWLNEGLAEFYSTFKLIDDGKRATIGLPRLDHLRQLNGSIKIPLADLLKVDHSSRLYNEGSRATDFYAESWALLHMLVNGQPSRMPELGEYLHRVRDGMSEPQAWEQVFGTSRTEQDLRLYIKRPILQAAVVTFPDKVASQSVTDTPLTDTDTAAFLGGLHLRIHGASAAASLVEPALARQPAHPLANSVMAEIDLARRNVDAAEERLAAIGAPKDWFAAYLAGTTLSEAGRSHPGAAGRDEILRTATSLLEQVRRDHTELANVLAELTKIELERDTPPSAAARANIERARALAPGRVDYILADAQLFAQSRNFAGARAVLGPLMTPEYPEDVRNSTRRLMAALVDLERGASRSPAVTPSSSSRSIAVPDGDADRPRSSSVGGRFVPAYRALQPGEQRLEGSLEQIDCRSGAPAIFRVQAREGPVDLEGRLADVEFLAYRDDLKGPVTCGPQAPMRVYVSWREGSASRHEKVVVAVEFLPKD